MTVSTIKAWIMTAVDSRKNSNGADAATKEPEDADMVENTEVVEEKESEENAQKDDRGSEEETEPEPEAEAEAEEDKEKEDEEESEEEAQKEPDEVQDEVEMNAANEIEEEEADKGAAKPSGTGVKHRPKQMALRKHATKQAPKPRGRLRKDTEPKKFTTPEQTKRIRSRSQWVSTPFTEANTDEIEGRKKKPRTKA
ncbi:hypothetical protein Bca101_050231 [Brassica carinata]